MFAASALLTFCLAFFVFAASPGPDNLAIVSKTVADGPAHGLAYGAGVVCSIFGFVILAAVGFDALSGVLNGHLHWLQYAGAAYLVYTGVTTWRAAVTVKPRVVKGGLVRLFFTGLILNLSNPKMPIFYLALLPGVLGLGPVSMLRTLVLLGLIGVIEVVVIGGHVWAGLKAKRALTDPRRLRGLNRGAGAVMIGAGVWVAAR